MSGQGEEPFPWYWNAIAEVYLQPRSLRPRVKQTPRLINKHTNTNTRCNMNATAGTMWCLTCPSTTGSGSGNNWEWTRQTGREERPGKIKRGRRGGMRDARRSLGGDREHRQTDTEDEERRGTTRALTSHLDCGSVSLGFSAPAGPGGDETGGMGRGMGCWGWAGGAWLSGSSELGLVGGWTMITVFPVGSEHQKQGTLIPTETLRMNDRQATRRILSLRPGQPFRVLP